SASSRGCATARPASVSSTTNCVFPGAQIKFLVEVEPELIFCWASVKVRLISYSEILRVNLGGIIPASVICI
ncbi:TPA: hypothetical protein ACIYR1_005238, partial [Escherichia coli]